MTKKKTKELVNNPSDTKVIPEETLEEIFTSLTKGKKDSKQSTFFLYWMFGFPQKVAAMKAGYSESYASKLVAKYKKVPKVRQRVDQILNMFPERYRAVCQMRLPQVAEIEGLALDELTANPKLAVDKPQLLKQVKQGSGVEFGEKDDAPPVTINIKAIEKIQIATTEMLEQRLKKLTE